MTDPGDDQTEEPFPEGTDEPDTAELEDEEAFFDVGGVPDGDDRLVGADSPEGAQAEAEADARDEQCP